MRGYPNGIFNPWVCWITCLALAENSYAAVVLALWDDQCEMWKIGEEEEQQQSEMRTEACIRQTPLRAGFSNARGVTRMS